MRMKIPITGTVAEAHPYVSGDDKDPIRLIRLPFGNVSFKVISLDIEREEMEIEVTPSPTVQYETGEVYDNGKPVLAQRNTTSEERDAMIENARKFSLERKSKDELYALSGSPRLVNPFKVIPIKT